MTLSDLPIKPLKWEKTPFGFDFVAKGLEYDFSLYSPDNEGWIAIVRYPDQSDERITGIVSLDIAKIAVETLWKRKVREVLSDILDLE